MAADREIVEALLKTRLFSGSSAQLIEETVFDGSESVIRYGKNDAVLLKSSFKRSLGFVVSGEVAVLKHNSNIVIRSVTTGEFFAGECIYSPRTYSPAEIVAVMPSKVLLIDRSAVYKLMMRDQMFSSGFIAMLSETVYSLYSSIGIYTAGSAEARLAGYLNENFAGYKTFEMRQSYSSLAVSLDIARASLYRAFDSLIEAGAIEKDGKNIRLLNEDKLRSFI